MMLNFITKNVSVDMYGNGSSDVAEKARVDWDYCIHTQEDGIKSTDIIPAKIVITWFEDNEEMTKVITPADWKITVCQPNECNSIVPSMVTVWCEKKEAEVSFY